jgi:hypothetical protein
MADIRSMLIDQQLQPMMQAKTVSTGQDRRRARWRSRSCGQAMPAQEGRPSGRLPGK